MRRARIRSRRRRGRRLAAAFSAVLAASFLASTGYGAGEPSAGELAEKPQVAPAPPITALAFAPDTQTLLVGSQAGIEARGWPELGVERRLDTELAHVHDLVFSPDGVWLAAAGGEPASRGALEVWSWPEGRRVLARSDHGDLIYAVAWSPDSKQLACASYDRTVGLYDAASGRRLQRLEGHSRAVLAVSYAGDRETVVSAGVDLSLRVWSTADGKRRRVLDNHTGAVRDLAARPRGESGGLPMLASVGEDHTLRLWQPTIGRLVRFVRLPARPLAVEWSATGESVVAACDDGHLRVVDPDRVEVIQDTAAVEGWAYSVAVAPWGKDVAVGGERGQLARVAIDKAANTKPVPDQ